LPLASGLTPRQFLLSRLWGYRLSTDIWIGASNGIFWVVAVAQFPLSSASIGTSASRGLGGGRKSV